MEIHTVELLGFVGWKDCDDTFAEWDEVECWAKQNCKSYIEMNIVDVTGLCDHDYEAHYSFTNEQDVTLFQLRWSWKSG